MLNRPFAVTNVFEMYWICDAQYVCFWSACNDLNSKFFAILGYENNNLIHYIILEFNFKLLCNYVLFAGRQGFQGSTGPTGLNGATGQAGRHGATGITGPRGVPGAGVASEYIVFYNTSSSTYFLHIFHLFALLKYKSYIKVHVLIGKMLCFVRLSLILG